MINKPRLRPVASPQSRIGGGANYRQQGLQEPLDLSPLSQTLTGIAVDMQRTQNDEELEAGAAAFSSLSADDNAKGFDQLVREGKIAPNANPYWRRGYMQASGRTLATQYYAGVRDRLSSLGEVQDSNGQMVEPPSLESIMQSEWEKVAGGAAMQNEYGRQSALLQKGDFDARLLVEGTEIRSNAELTHRMEQAKAELSTKVLSVVDADLHLTTDDIEQIQEYYTQEIKGGGFPDTRATIWELTQAVVAQVEDTQGAEAALHALDQLTEFPVGTTPLSKDTKFRQQIESLQDIYERKQEEETANELKDLRNRNQLQVERARTEYLDDLSEAARKGLDPREVANAYLDKWKAEGTYGEQYGVVAENILTDAARFYSQLTTRPEDDPASVEAVYSHVNSGDLSGALEHAEGLVESGDMTQATFAKVAKDIAQRRDLTPITTELPSRNSMITSLGGVFSVIRDDLGDELSLELEEMSEAAIRQADEAQRAYAAEIIGGPDSAGLMDTWVAKNRDTFLEPLEVRRREIVEGRNAALSSIKERLNQQISAQEQIEAAVTSGYMSSSEAQDWISKNQSITDYRGRFGSTESIQDAGQAIRTQAVNYLLENEQLQDFVREDGFSGGKTLRGPAATLVAKHERAMMQRIYARIPKEFAGNTQNHSAIVATIAHEEMLRSNGELMSDMDSNILRLASAQGMRNVEVAQQEVRNGKSAAAYWRLIESQELTADTLQRVSRVPLEDEGVLALQLDMMNGEISPYDASRKLNKWAHEQASMPEGEGSSRQAIRAIAPTGRISAFDVLAGEVTIKDPELERRQADLNRNRNLIYRRPGYVSAVNRQRDKKLDVTVPLDPKDINPFTDPLFDTVGEMEFFVAENADPDGLPKGQLQDLMEDLGLVADRESAEEFINGQRAAITRIQ